MNRQRILLGAILLGYLLVTLAYGAVNPLFESPDEHWHFFTVVEIAGTSRLPAVTDPPDEWLGQEAAQPPLYYLLGAALIAPVDTGGARDTIRLNPYAWIGDASALANINRMVHTPAEEWPWQGWMLAAHVLRVFSTLLGLGTLLCIYKSGRLLWPEGNTRPLMATALAAFLPQFNFIHASITNDALITFLCSLGIFQLIRFWRDPPTGERLGRHDALRLVALGLTAGLAALSKNAGVLLLLYSLGFLVVLAVRDRNYRLIGHSLLLVGLPAVLVAGWLWVRNQALYGDWAATAPFITIAGGDRDYSLWQVLGESWGLATSFVGVFGWFNLRPPNWVYWSWVAIAVLAVTGGLICTIQTIGRARRGAELVTHHSSPGQARGPAPTLGQTRGSAQGQARGLPLLVSRISYFVSQSDWFLALLLAVWPLAVYAGLVMFMMKTEAAQGRLLFPAIAPIALGAAWGLSGWGRCAPRALGAVNRRLAPLVALLVVATSIYSVTFVIRPAYAPPPTVTLLPSDARPILPELVDRGLGVSLLAAEVDTETARPGDIVWLTLYWRADDEAAEAPEFVLELLGRDLDRIANLHSYHGRGLYPAGLWPPGTIIADRFAVRIDPDAEAPVLGRVFVHIEGGTPGIEVATVRVVPVEPLPPPADRLAEIGDNIALVGATIEPEQALPGQSVRVLVRWYVPVGEPRQDYTTLIHLGQPDAPPLSTGDSPPLGGFYPTGAWRNGETIDDSYVLVIPVGTPPGRYPVWIGLYNPATGERLPVKVEGELQPNGVYLAGWVEVGEE